MFLSNFLGMLSAFILIWGQTNLRIRNVGVAQRTSNTHTYVYGRKVNMCWQLIFAVRLAFGGRVIK